MYRNTALLLGIDARRVRLFALVLSAALATQGCSYTYYVTADGTVSRKDTVTVALFNKRMADRSAVVSTKVSQEYSASQIVLARDSCAFLDQESQKQIVLSVKDIRVITRKEHLSSTIGGLGLGFAGGLALGGAIVIVTHPQGADERMGAGLAALATTALGTVGGLVIGAIQGTTTEYRLGLVQDSVAAQDSWRPVLRGKTTRGLNPSQGSSILPRVPL